MSALRLLAAITLVAIALIGWLPSSQAAPASYEITSLPGLTTPINFKQYSGYINVDQKMGKNLFFWFVTSQRNPSKDPVLLWMNGGPGASSLLGFFEEHGPFRPNSDGKTLSLDPYAWNQIANIIYLEAPVGVGFSYATNTSAYTIGDQVTAEDNYQFLLNWFQLFPEFAANDFYITGESYGGHYVPELASLVLDGLQNGTNNINIKGLMAGNPGTNNDWYYNEDEWAFITFMYSHGLIPQTAYSNAVAACGWDHFLVDVCTKSFNNPTPDCRKATARAITYLPRNIDMYDVYAPVCHSRLGNNSHSFGEYISRWHPLKKVDPTISFDPCLQDYTTSYLNQPAVQQAIHARPTQWEWVSSVLKYQNETANMIPLWQRFLNQTNWRMLVYSGDVDAAVPFLDTQSWISCLGQPIVRDWHNWEYNKQVAGSLIQYQGITFLTIKGAGHMVPYYLPAQGFAFFERWLQNKRI